MREKPKKRVKQGGFKRVFIPTPLFKRLKERIRGTEFTSVSSYITYLLREVMAEEKKEAEEPFSKENEERIKARLRALGYID